MPIDNNTAYQQLPDSEVEAIMKELEVEMEWIAMRAKKRLYMHIG